jgi:dihydroxyacid dehydratase/phosphogluconate dehydratase
MKLLNEMPIKGFSTFAESLLYAMGRTPEEIAKPGIAIVNSASTGAVLRLPTDKIN